MRAPVSHDLLSDSPLRKQARGGVSIDLEVVSLTLKLPEVWGNTSKAGMVLDDLEVASCVLDLEVVVGFITNHSQCKYLKREGFITNHSQCK